MREILFKGKRIDNGEWVDGFYHYFDYRYNGDTTRRHSILPVHAQDSFAVDPETVSQSLEMRDRHKVSVFENDIVEFIGASTHRYLIWWNRESSMMTAVPLDGIYFNGHDYGNMEYPNFDYSTFCLMMQDPWGDFRDIKVIGNKFDNPELLEGVTQYV